MNRKITFITVFLICLNTILATTYQRIISLAPSFTKQLYLLNAEDKLIANTTYCNFPKEAKNKPKIGSMVQIDIEKIVSLKPDLVLATGMTKPRLINNLSRLGIKVIIINSPNNFDEICKDLIQIGSLCGNSLKANKIVKQAKLDFIKVKKLISSVKKKKIFMQVGSKPLFAVIPGNFIDEMINLAGGINVVTQKSTGIYSREKVLIDNPEFILITTMGIAGTQEKKIWKKYKSIEAVKKNNIFLIKSQKLLSPTPSEFIESVKLLSKIINPTLRL